MRSEMVAQAAITHVITGMIAAAAPDWRLEIDRAQTLAEACIGNVQIDGRGAEPAQIRAGAIRSLWASFDQLHVALSVAERGETLPSVDPTMTGTTSRPR